MKVNMKKYVKPSIEIADFEVATIISTSIIVDDNKVTDSDANMINSRNRDWGNIWGNN
ncbi:MAG: hypothetical protein IKD38_03790 [Bacteroidaceae bacterium]|nr:hypothetical protein [Bacteroidaceae bacterium]